MQHVPTLCGPDMREGGGGTAGMAVSPQEVLLQEGQAGPGRAAAVLPEQL